MTDHHFRQILEAIYHNELKMYSKIKELRMTIDDLKAKLDAQSKAIDALAGRIPSPPPPPIDLQPIADGIDANTAKIEAIVPPAVPVA